VSDGVGRIVFGAPATTAMLPNRASDTLLLHRREGSRHGREEMAEEVARFLLRGGYGTDFSMRTTALDPGEPGPIRPPVEVLEAMVRLAANDVEFAWLVDHEDPGAEENAYYVLSEELGDWRSES